MHQRFDGSWATLNTLPELPEVETIRKQLDPLLRACNIVEVWAFDSPKFTQAHHALGCRLNGVRRRGKYLLVDLIDPDSPLDPLELIVHLGMTGLLSVSSNTASVTSLHSVEPNTRQQKQRSSWEQSATTNMAELSASAVGQTEAMRHLRAVWTLDDGRNLYFDDVRRFGRIAVVNAGDYQSLATLAALGPEPFDSECTPEYLRKQINLSKRSVKAQLLAQRLVAGLGNIYVDESLWRAQVHPAAKRITVLQSQRLCQAMSHVLQSAINNGGTTLRNYRDAEGASGTNQRYLDCYGRAGQSCTRCDTTLERIVIDARSTVFCPNCQRR